MHSYQTSEKISILKTFTVGSFSYSEEILNMYFVKNMEARKSISENTAYNRLALHIPYHVHQTAYIGADMKSAYLPSDRAIPDSLQQLWNMQPHLILCENKKC